MAEGQEDPKKGGDSVTRYIRPVCIMQCYFVFQSEHMVLIYS